MVKVEVGGHPILEISNNEKGGRRQSIKRRIRSDQPVHFNWDNVQPRLIITSDTDDFDHEILVQFQEEGYQIWYLPYSGNHEAYNSQLQHLADPLELGETYAIVAYGDAASLCLEACQHPMPKLSTLIAYYPPYMPNNSSDFPPSLNLQIHLAGSQKFGTREPSHRYPNTEPGFAESDLEEYDACAARLAWSRMLGALRQGFKVQKDLEPTIDKYLALKFETKDAKAIMDMMVPHPDVNNVPTMTGGDGYDELHRFYKDFFIPNNPPSLKFKLLSRTVGTDRVVDEMLLTFRHTCEMPWILPGIPPTDKEVEIVVVMIVTIRGSKVRREHTYWDQASVLVQIGLLDPKLIPNTFQTAQEGQEKDVRRLPVCGKETARKVIDEHNGQTNELLPNW